MTILCEVFVTHRLFFEMVKKHTVTYLFLGSVISHSYSLVCLTCLPSLSKSYQNAQFMRRLFLVPPRICHREGTQKRFVEGMN